MKKADLVAHMADQAGITKRSAQVALEAVLDQLSMTLEEEGHFVLTGVGTFEVVKRPKRIARNPQTGEPVTVPAHNAVRFKAAKALKEAVN